MTTYFIVAIVLLLVALGLIIASTIAGFRISKKVGFMILLAPLLLATSMTLVSYFAYEVGASQCGEAEAHAKGEAEADDQIEALEEVENIDIGL